MGGLQQDLVALLPRLRRFARALTRDRSDADDLVQLSMERALRRAHQFRPGLKLENWVFGIMKHAWIDELRAGKRRSAVILNEPADVAGTSEPETVIALREAFELLPQDQRLAVALVLVEGLSYRDAAEVAGVPEGTLTSRVARGRAVLITAMSEDAP